MTKQNHSMRTNDALIENIDLRKVRKKRDLIEVRINTQKNAIGPDHRDQKLHRTRKRCQKVTKSLDKMTMIRWMMMQVLTRKVRIAIFQSTFITRLYSNYIRRLFIIYIYLPSGGHTPVRDAGTAQESDVEDGELSEEEIDSAHKVSKGHKTLARSQRESNIEPNNDTEDETDEVPSKRRRKESSSRKRDQKPSREKPENSNSRKESRRTRSRRKSPSDEEDDEKDNGGSHGRNGYHRDKRMEEDEEALPGDVPFNPSKSRFVNDKEDLMPDKEVATSSQVSSLSVEETNKLRAKLGLKPLKISGNEGGAKKEGTQKVEATNENKEFSHLEIIPGTDVRHNPAESLTEKLSADKLREKLKRKRLRRQQEAKLLAVKGIADSSDEDVSSWVKSQKYVQEEKERAKKRAQMFEELDDDFGIGNLVDADKKETIKKETGYDSKALKGLAVQHSFDRFKEGKDMILTLKDADILDEEAMDTLVNVNVVDDERAEKNVIDIKKAKQAYNKYDAEDVDDVTGEIERKNILYKYDEEIDGVQKKTFVIGKDGQFNQEEEDMKRREEIRKKLHGNRNVVSLNTSSLKLASDYLTQEEAAASTFKKVKKKKKVKQRMLKADDLLDQLDEEQSHGDQGAYDPYKDVEMEPMPPPSTSILGKKLP